MLRFTTGVVGRGKAVHVVHAHGGRRGQATCGKTASAFGGDHGAATCLTCLKAAPSWRNNLTDAEVAALAPTDEEVADANATAAQDAIDLEQDSAAMAAEFSAEFSAEAPNEPLDDVQVGSEWESFDVPAVRVRVTRTVEFPFPRVSYESDSRTGTLPLGWFLSAYRRVRQETQPVYLASTWAQDKGVRYLFLGTELDNGETFAWVRNPAGGQMRVTLAELVQRFVAVPSGEETEDEVRWDQVWRSRYVSERSQWFEVRVVEVPSTERVAVRSMANGKRSTLSKAMFVELFRWTPESGAENYGRAL